MNDYDWIYFGRGFDSRHLHHIKNFTFTRTIIKGNKRKIMGHLTNILDWIRGNSNTGEATASPAGENSADVSSFTVNELKNLAKERGLKGYSTLRKADLIKLLND